MAFITLSGTLRDPTSELAVGDQIRFTHKSTTGETVEGAVSVLTIDPSGTYSKDLQYGLVLVEYKDVRTSQFKNIGVAIVNGSNPATSIPELLNALVPVSSAELIEFQAILADAVTARDEAEAFANSIDLINDLSQAYIFDTVATYKASAIVFPVGKTVHLNDRGADFKVIAGTASGNGIVVSTTINQSLVLTVERPEKIQDYGANSTDTDGAAALQLAFDGIADTPTRTYDIKSTVLLKSGDIIRMNGDEIAYTGTDYTLTVSTEASAGEKFGIVVTDLKVKNRTEVFPATYHAAFAIRNANGARAHNNEVYNCRESMQLGFGSIPVTSGGERRTTRTVATNNILRGYRIGFEAFSLAYSAVTGNISSSDNPAKGTQHGMRITGYGRNHLNAGNDLRNRGNNYSGNISHNYANGLSLQAGVWGNNIDVVVTDAINGITTTDNSTLADAISASNNLNFAVDGAEYGAFLNDPKSSIFRGVVRECTTSGFSTFVASREAKNNIYDLALTECINAGRFEDSNSKINIVASDMTEGGVTITGSFNIIDICADDFNKSGSSSAALFVSGNNNIIRITGTALLQAFAEASITGDNNIIDFSLETDGTKGKVTVTGANNKVRGFCNVSATSVSGNDYSQVAGWSGVGSVSITTDASGNANLGIDSSMPTNSDGYSLDVSTTEFTNPRLVARKGAADSIQVITAVGATPVNSTTMTIKYSYINYIA